MIHLMMYIYTESPLLSSFSLLQQFHDGYGHTRPYHTCKPNLKSLARPIIFAIYFILANIFSIAEKVFCKRGQDCFTLLQQDVSSILYRLYYSRRSLYLASLVLFGKMSE